jgi:DNA polymerase III epsilon subunit-like protein
MRTLFLDTETTGLSGRTDRLVEIAIVGETGEVLLNTLINPGRPIPAEASRIHGITDHLVREAPAFEMLWPTIQKMVRGNRVVIYNAGFDCKFFPQRLACAAKIECAMLAYAGKIGEPHPRRRGEYRWHKLIEAAHRVGYSWSSPAHRALGDALACRSVWLWVRDGQEDRNFEPRNLAERWHQRREQVEKKRRPPETPASWETPADELPPALRPTFDIHDTYAARVARLEVPPETPASWETPADELPPALRPTFDIHHTYAESGSLSARKNAPASGLESGPPSTQGHTFSPTWRWVLVFGIFTLLLAMLAAGGR